MLTFCLLGMEQIQFVGGSLGFRRVQWPLVASIEHVSFMMVFFRCSGRPLGFGGYDGLEQGRAHAS